MPAGVLGDGEERGWCGCPLEHRHHPFAMTAGRLRAGPCPVHRGHRAKRGRVGGSPTRGFSGSLQVCMFRRMPRMQVYLPEDLHRAVKERGLAASELLQEAVRVELRRQELLEASDEYLSQLLEDVGQPGAEETLRARAIAGRLARRADDVAG